MSMEEVKKSYGFEVSKKNSTQIAPLSTQTAPLSTQIAPKQHLNRIFGQHPNSTFRCCA